LHNTSRTVAWSNSVTIKISFQAAAVTLGFFD
jgi:hypothetical protein